MIAAFSLVVVCLTGPAHAAKPVPEVFALGQSRASGAICDASRDYQDPIAMAGTSKAWRVRCRGYSTALGRVYQLPTSQKAAWQSALAQRAECSTGTPAPGGLPAKLSTCKLIQGGAPYVVFLAEQGAEFTVVEGLAPLADVAETALKVALGMASPPNSTMVQTSAAQAEIAADFPNMMGLAAAEAAASTDPDRLRARAYVQNNEWQFDEAETAFRALASDGETRNAPASQRAEALLNLAMNISNNERFEEAEGYFTEAEAFLVDADPLVRARSLNYRALHERNRGRFAAAISAAKSALSLRATVSGGQTEVASVLPAGKSTGPLVIDALLARRLNTPSVAQSQIAPLRVTLPEQLAIQDAQAWQVIGTSQAALGDRSSARVSLMRADDILQRSAAVGRLAAWLQSRVDADLARMDLQEGRASQAVIGYQKAVATLRTRHAGSAAEAALLMDLGRTQIVAGRDADALVSYGRAMSIFRTQRGGLGGSADQAGAYLDLLLKEAKANPARADEFGALFFEVAQSVVSDATGETINRLAARVAASDTTVSGLSRAFEDARRRLRATESQIAALQADGAYDATVRAEMEALLRAGQADADSLEAQLLAANPRYNQLVTSGASAAAIQKALKPGEAYLKLLPLAGATYGVLITQESLVPYAVALDRAGVQAAVTYLRLPFVPQERLIPYDVAAAAELFEKLFGSVKSQILAAKHLIYEPEGALVSLPISLLVTDTAKVRTGADGDTDYTRVAWLGTKVSSSLAVSGASFLQSRAFAPSRATKGYLGFGDPALPRGQEQAYTSVTRSLLRRSAVLERVCGETRNALLQIEALPETLAEVRAIGDSFGTPTSVVTGAAFSDDAVRARNDLADYRVLYFATHGLLPQPEACVPEPALVTSLGLGDSDALLDTSEILMLKMDADLVVLAACDTGGAGASVDRTGLTGGGEALGGLTRSMIYAGARALVVSHWSIESESAVRLMTGLFASKAPSLAQALQSSQAALQADPRYAHPYFWAPFTLVGDGARALPSVAQQVASNS